MKINWSTFNYNYAAVEPTFLSAIDFLTNGTVNRIICDDYRINCNFLALSYSLNLEQCLILWYSFNVNWITPIYCAISIKILNWIVIMHFRCKLDTSKTTLKQIANIKEFLNLLSINHQISFILHLFLISYI